MRSTQGLTLVSIRQEASANRYRSVLATSPPSRTLRVKTSSTTIKDSRRWPSSFLSHKGWPYTRTTRMGSPAIHRHGLAATLPAAGCITIQRIHPSCYMLPQLLSSRRSSGTTWIVLCRWGSSWMSAQPDQNRRGSPLRVSQARQKRPRIFTRTES